MDMTLEISYVAYVSMCKYFTRFSDAATQIPVKQSPWATLTEGIDYLEVG